MKKIAFFVQWLLCGGVENSLIALSDRLIKEGNDVTIYMITHKGEFINKIPEGVYLREIPMREKIRKSIPVGGTRIAVRTSLLNRKYIQAARFIVKYRHKSKFAELSIDLDKIPVLDDYYDIAVNYHIHSPFLVWYLSERVKAKIKLSWIHNDFYTTKYDIRALNKYLKCINDFYGVSQNVVNEFVELLPEYKNNTHVALNIVPVNEITEKACEYYPKEFNDISEDKLKILTVGRLEEQKGYDIAIKVCKRLIEQNLLVEWFVLGDGTQRTELETNIHKLGVEKYFHLLGTRMNPYPYFKNCDIYIQTSRHEGYGIAVAEAKIFERPIVCTNVAGACEQLVDGVNGDIADINEDEIFRKAKRLIESADRRTKYSDELRKEIITGEPEWLKVFR